MRGDKIVVIIILISLPVLAIRYQIPQSLFRSFLPHPQEAIKRASFDEVFDLDLSTIDTSEWVDRYLPQKAYNGFTLILFYKRIPLLIDMNGNIVHSWPMVRSIGRIRLTHEGNFLVICLDNTVREYDRDGGLTQELRNPETEYFPHHDLARTSGGSTLVLYRDEGKKNDYILQFNSDGRVIWKWKPEKVVEENFRERIRHPEDIMHINSVHELPPNRWFDLGDTRFRPGNLLMCARNLNTIFIIDRESGDLVWQFYERLDYPHEARMIERDQPGAGNIQIFDNGLENRYRYHKSMIIEIDPTDGSISWSYSSPYFFSSLAGIQQGLPNGNVLIVSSRGGRSFEINREGEIVWQWIPPFNPMRPERYPYDHCPQFERLGIPTGKTIHSRRTMPYVDQELYHFFLPDEGIFKEIGGKRRKLLNQIPDCRTLLIPAGALLHVGYGFDREVMASDGISGSSARFILKIRSEGGGGENSAKRKC